MSALRELLVNLILTSKHRSVDLESALAIVRIESFWLSVLLQALFFEMLFVIAFWIVRAVIPTIIKRWKARNIT